MSWYGLAQKPIRFPQPVVTTTSLPQGTVGVPYSPVQLQGVGGLTPYTWAVLSNTPNTGNWLQVSTSGVLTGTPGTAEVESLSVQLTDSTGNLSPPTALTLTVAAGLTITTSSLPNAVTGQGYSAPLTVTGGTPPYIWSLTSATPDTGNWLSVSGSNLVGTPLTAETESVTVKVVDSGGAGLNASTTLSLVITSPTVTKSWHPGHYVMSLFAGNYTSATQAARQASWNSALSGDSRFVGVRAIYSWFQLEPRTQGTYVYTLIDNDLAWLQANWPGKKLIIEVWSRAFNLGTSQPTLPQSITDGNAKVPDYIVSGTFTNSGGQPGSTWNQNGVLAAFWSPAVLARMQALDAALAARYDTNPTVEQICYDEFSPPAPSSGAPTLGYSLSAQQSSWQTFHTSMSANWSHANVICMANFPNNTSGTSDAPLFSFMQGLKVGVGGPDILPSVAGGGNGETWGEQILRGAGVSGSNNFGTTDYRGILPISYEAENPQWIANPTQMETYVYNTLMATHATWLYNPTNVDASGTPGAGTTPWTTQNGITGVLNILQTQAFRIHGTVPTVYTGTLNITTTSVPNATVAVAYSQILAATGGTSPYTWSLQSASPNWNNWLTISSGGVLLGTPQMVETETIVVKVTDAALNTDIQQITLTVNPF